MAYSTSKVLSKCVSISRFITVNEPKSNMEKLNKIKSTKKYSKRYMTLRN